MGVGELATWKEWNHEATLDWTLHDTPRHDGIRRWIAALNQLYRDEPAMSVGDAEPAGFRWIIPDDDIPRLREAGVAMVFTPGTPMASIVEWVRENV